MDDRVFYREVPAKYYLVLRGAAISPEKRASMIGNLPMTTPLVKIKCMDEIMLIRADELYRITGVPFDGRKKC